MKTINIALGVAVGALILLSAGLYMGYQTYLASASVITGGEYETVIVTSADVGTTSIKTRYGSVGQVTVTDASAAGAGGYPLIVFYDQSATSSATTTMTAFAQIGNGSAAETTFTFDARFSTGLFMWVNPAFDGDATVMYR